MICRGKATCGVGTEFTERGEAGDGSTVAARLLLCLVCDTLVRHVSYPQLEALNEMVVITKTLFDSIAVEDDQGDGGLELSSPRSIYPGWRASFECRSRYYDRGCLAGGSRFIPLVQHTLPVDLSRHTQAGRAYLVSFQPPSGKHSTDIIIK